MSASPIAVCPTTSGAISPIGIPCCCRLPQSFKRRFNVDVRVFHYVIEIDKAGKTLLVRNLQTGEEQREYYDVLLSLEAAPIRPPFPGIYSPHVYTLRNILDMDRILAALHHDQPRHVTVVGGGFIGLVMMEALHQRKLDVTLLELADQVMGVQRALNQPLRNPSSSRKDQARIRLTLLPCAMSITVPEWHLPGSAPFSPPGRSSFLDTSELNQRH